MQKILAAVALISGFMLIQEVILRAQDVTEAEKLLNELQSPAKTDDATQQLFKLGKSYPEVRAYLASHLPAITKTATIA